MDPNVLLEQMREMLKTKHADHDCHSGCLTDLVELSTKFEELDDWISRGGFLPRAWSKTVTQ